MTAPLATTIRACATIRSLAGVVDALVGDSYISSKAHEVALHGYALAPDNGDTFTVSRNNEGSIAWRWATELGMTIATGAIGVDDTAGAHELARHFKLWIEG